MNATGARPSGAGASDAAGKTPPRRPTGVPSRTFSPGPAGIVLALVIIAVALNLRPALAAIGPLLDLIQAHAGLSHTQASLLTTLPVAAMGVCALFGRQLMRVCSERTGIAIGTALVGVACLLRWPWSTPAGLVCSAVLAGVGIALVQTLMPGFIKRGFARRAGRVMGLYTTGIMAGAAIAAASASPLAAHVGWPGALALWCLPAAAALLAWLLSVRAPARDTGPAHSRPQPRAPFWRHARAWTLLVFFGVGTGAYTLVLAWYPPFYTALGWSAAHAGYLLGGVTVTEVLAGLAVAAFIDRFPDRRGPLLLVLGLLLAGLACLILAPLTLALPGAVLLGAGIGALFPLSLILTLDHLEDPSAAGELTSFVQGGGYLMASLAPLLAGMLRDHYADLAHAWLVMVAGVLLLALLTLRFSPASYVRLGR